MHGTEKIKVGVAVLELKQSIVFTDKVRPICMPKRLQKIPDNPLCFMPVYQKDKKRVTDFIAPVAKHGNCAIWQNELGAANGYCIYYSDKIPARKLGAPLICLVGEKLVQFGVYTTRFDPNYKGTQKGSSIGYANDLTLMTSIIAGKLYETAANSTGKKNA
ncbi:Serine protease [Trichuris trichiura]|uniref:Serine protease n=1 Tax=Trichuris trichiura TaxID=36087 RepID=A0A077ZLN7_TRITR|nr:Serine protease [Trichuris trichiura]